MEKRIRSTVISEYLKNIFLPDTTLSGITNSEEAVSNSFLESDIGILLVCCNKNSVERMQKRVTKFGALHVKWVSSGIAALSEIAINRYDLVILEYDLPDMRGIDFCKQLQECKHDIPFLLLISPAGTYILEEVINAYSNVLLQKSSDPIPGNPDLCQKMHQDVTVYGNGKTVQSSADDPEETRKERIREVEMEQRFSVIGEIARMIGHDMRNPLQVITNMEYLAQHRIKQMSDIEYNVLERYGINSLLSTIKNETAYIDKIVSDLQDYARDIRVEKNLLYARQFFLEFQPLFAMNEKITYEVRIPDGLQICADKKLLQRAFSNLITNAIQAMPGEGILKIEAGILDNTTLIQVSDTGDGISEDCQVKIFDPLFTTKAKGTGFGLPVAKRIIEAHHGTIQLKSTARKGTVVSVTLPKDPVEK
ncbi:MAG: ATP-binding protein [Methanomicrobiales archaeon]